MISKKTMNLFGTDFMEEFDLRYLALSILCNKMNLSQSLSDNMSENLKLEIKISSLMCS